MQCFGLQASIKAGIWTNIAYTHIDAACEFHGLKAGETPNMGSCLGKILHAHLGKVI